MGTRKIKGPLKAFFGDLKPGSKEARLQGCKCPVDANGKGQGSGLFDELGNPTFWINDKCDLHKLEIAKAS